MLHSGRARATSQPGRINMLFSRSPVSIPVQVFETFVIFPKLVPCDLNYSLLCFFKLFVTTGFIAVGTCYRLLFPLFRKLLARVPYVRRPIARPCKGHQFSDYREHSPRKFPFVVCKLKRPRIYNFIAQHFYRAYRHLLFREKGDAFRRHLFFSHAWSLSSKSGQPLLLLWTCCYFFDPACGSLFLTRTQRVLVVFSLFDSLEQLNR